MTVRSIQVEVPAWVSRRKTEVMYLVLGPDGFPKLRDVIDLDITERLAAVLSRHVHAHVNEGESPPKEIAPAILNIADDVLSGKSPTLRAGHYISLQRYVRSGGR